MPDPENTLTLLTTMGVAATKTFTVDDNGRMKVQGYGRAKRFTADEVAVDAKGRWLKRLATKRESFVVMGQPVGWKPGERRRRLSSARDGDDPTIIDVPRLWLPIDIDQLDFEPIAEIDDGETFAVELLDRLKLTGAHCVWHLTNTHGFFDKYRARLWIRLAKAMTCEQMRAFAKDRWGDDKVEVDGVRKCIVDMSVYRPAQPIYTGDPVIKGIDDPVKRRVGCIEGAPLKVKVTAKAKRSGAPADDNVAMLEAAGLYIGRLKPGQHMIVCPWEDEHSGEERDDDTFYFEPHHNGHDIPAFKCHHASCESKRWDDVVSFLGIDEGGSDDEGDGEPGWIFVYRLKSFWDARDGALVDREAYDATHGGTSKRGTPTQRFLSNKATLKADIAEFLPGEGRFVKRGRLRALNTYVDQRVQPDESIDHSPWVEHLEWLIPDDVDRGHFMDWLAWAYRYPGRKITWAPVLYSSSPGVGKTTAFNRLAACIGLSQVSEPTQAELEDKFNDWCYGKLLVKIEELMSGDKYHVAEKLKPIVANPSVSVRRMHQTGFTVANVANVCASTNHMQALPIEASDRRWMLIQCVEAAAKERKPRMRQFHRWLESVGHGGIAAWFMERDLSHFVPTSEAPDTRLKSIVAEASKTDLDRAVDLCDVFDRAPVLSSMIVAEFLAAQECSVHVRRLGLIAAQRGWLRMNPRGERRVMIAGRKVTLWSPSGDETELKRLLQMNPAERDRTHANLLAKLCHDPESTGRKAHVRRVK